MLLSVLQCTGQPCNKELADPKYSLGLRNPVLRGSDFLRGGSVSKDPCPHSRATFSRGLRGLNNPRTFRPWCSRTGQKVKFRVG